MTGRGRHFPLTARAEWREQGAARREETPAFNPLEVPAGLGIGKRDWMSTLGSAGGPTGRLPGPNRGAGLTAKP